MVKDLSRGHPMKVEAAEAEASLVGEEQGRRRERNLWRMGWMAGVARAQDLGDDPGDE